MTTKEKVIEALEKEKGSYVSGEALASSCNVSRNAIWKSINELRKSGYVIRSVNNRGYMLEEDSDIISKAGICIYLNEIPGEKPEGGERTLKTERETGAHIGTDAGSEAGADREIDADRIHVYDELDSTNSEAKRSLFFRNDRMIHGTVFVARHQTAGRGHGGSRFSSPEGGIYLSMILEPDRIKDRSRPVTEIISDAVREVIERFYRVQTEGHSDSSVYVGDVKVCGILTEGISDLETGIYSNYIVGIGIRAEILQKLGGMCPQRNAVIAHLIRGLHF